MLANVLSRSRFDLIRNVQLEIVPEECLSLSL